MKVICLKNQLYGFEMKRVAPYAKDIVEYPININKEFIVMGLQLDINTNNIKYLIQNIGLPLWYPQQLFTISENTIPENWFVKHIVKNNAGKIFFLTGFDELCNNDDFHDALMEREDWALQIFYKRLKEQEEYYEDQYWIKLGQQANKQ